MFVALLPSIAKKIPEKKFGLKKGIRKTHLNKRAV
jgi:hypothetical protein